MDVIYIRIDGNYITSHYSFLVYSVYSAECTVGMSIYVCIFIFFVSTFTFFGMFWCGVCTSTSTIHLFILLYSSSSSSSPPTVCVCVYFVGHKLTS